MYTLWHSRCNEDPILTPISKLFRKNYSFQRMLPPFSTTSSCEAPPKATLPKLTMDEVAKHKTASSLWVVYKNIVYDATDFLEGHPGGSGKLLLAGGTHLEPFWGVFKQHENRAYVIKDVLGALPIVGELREEDKVFVHKIDNPYIHEPVRTGGLRYHSITPCNAETEEEGLRTFITDAADYYCRHHGPVPVITSSTSHEVSVGGMKMKSDRLKDIGEMKDVTMTMQCGGNRRGRFEKFKKTSGTQWDIGAISTATWSGVSLRSVLFHCYTNGEISAASHVHVTGVDGTLISLPLSRVLDDSKNVILATKMNGDDIPADHGFPVRLIVPGVVGVRNIKWVEKIDLKGEEADSMWQSGNAYKVLPPSVKDPSEVNIMDFKPMMEMPVQSAVTNAVKANDGAVEASGFAYSGGGRKIAKVEVSLDGGVTWSVADLKEGSEQDSGRAWAWTLWEYKGLDGGKGTVMCRAIDEEGRGQPGEVEGIWNLRGLACNVWHERALDDDDEDEEE